MKTCPYCAEEIQTVAVKCRHCSSDLTATRRGAPSARLIAGIVFFGAVVLWLALVALAGWALAEAGLFRPIVPAWNSLLAVGAIAIFVGLCLRQEWARQWAAGTSVLTSLNAAYTLIQSQEIGPALGLAAALISAGCLSGEMRKEFAATLPDGQIKQDRTADVLIALGLIAGSVAVGVVGRP